MHALPDASYAKNRKGLEGVAQCGGVAKVRCL